MANKQISLEQLSDIYAFRVIGQVDRRLLSRARRRSHHVADGAGPFQGLHLDAEAEQLPVDPHHDRRPAPSARRAADPHPRNARHRRVRRCRARHLQGCDRHQRSRRCRRQDAGQVQEGQPGRTSWLRRLVETLLEGSNPEEFLEHTKLELFQDQVFCFTPKGRLIAFRVVQRRSTSPMRCTPTSATPPSAPYVNGRHVPIDTRLRNGDEVEIQTLKAIAARGVGELRRHWPRPVRHPPRSPRSRAQAIHASSAAG